MGQQPASAAENFPTKLAHGLWLLALAIFVGATIPVRAGELESLRAKKDLTPEQFLRSFADFRFELADEQQQPEIFLKRKAGDCDDFANLAATVLSERGYKTKIVVVMMPEQAHVVCYVKEAGGILDFNHRADAQPVVPSDGSLEDIAEKTAAYFRCAWQMASEIRYENSRPVYVNNSFPRVRPTTAPVIEVTAEAPNVFESPARVSSAPATIAVAEKEVKSPPTPAAGTSAILN